MWMVHRGQTSRDQRSDFTPASQSEHEDEVFEVLWEIGEYVIGFLAIALVIKLLFALFGGA